jgi:hypothetical protein
MHLFWLILLIFLVNKCAALQTETSCIATVIFDVFEINFYVFFFKSFYVHGNNCL